jgi:hypothetical protein
MSLTNLRLMQEKARREGGSVEAAVNAASWKKAPALSKLGLEKVTALSGKLVVEGHFEASPYGHTKITISPNTLKATAECHFFLTYTGTTVFGDVGSNDVKALLRRLKQEIEAGEIVATAAVELLLSHVG